MATVDSANQSSMASSTGRGRGRQRGGGGRVAFLNFGKRQQQAPEEPLQDQQPLNVQPDSQSQQSSEPDRPRGRSWRSRARRGGKGKGKEEETSSETGRITPVFESGEAASDRVEAMNERTVQSQLGDGHTMTQHRSINDGGDLAFTLRPNTTLQSPSSSGSKGTTSAPAMQKRSSRSEEELRALIESERGKMKSREKKPVPVVNPNAVRDMKRVESQRLSIDVKPSASYNNWGDAPPGSRQVGGRRKGKDKEKGSDSRPSRAGSRAGSRQPRQHQEDLPQGSHLLGDAPQGSPPNQRRAPPTSRRFGGNLTENESKKVNPTNSPRVATPDQDRPKNSRVVPSRSFGGHLTTTLPDTDDSIDATKLRPDATAFEPGKPVESLPPHLRAIANRGKASPPKYDSWGPGGDPGRRSPQRPAPHLAPQAGNSRGKVKQQSFKLDGKKFPIIQNMRPHTNTFQGAEDIGTRVHKEIASGVYECMVCYGGLTRKARIWNCKCCWAVFHLNCVQKWAKQGLEQPPSRQSGVDGEPSKRSWRCPACNNPDDGVPETYTCWCEKTVQPEASKYLPPHR